jgi:twitching motility two-component system response regulator PilH
LKLNRYNYYLIAIVIVSFSSEKFNNIGTSLFLKEGFMSRILVVDDSWLIRQTVTNMLKRAGYEITIAENGGQALEKCNSDKFDCVLLDLLMPDMSGLDVVKKLKEMNITIPIIILTADIQSTTQQRCRDAGVADFLIKPPKEEHLIYKLQTILSAKDK